ncbi:MAG: hypothetical protein H6565_05745 [Lewinellaceae bacterium]|nr:hypothetical protein [Saprospiraceae bacterium]MCB9306078.1 hypothetical protein [Lewinellaceae bacterium]MCB9356230.1 hypothetical protein [Lewinellaceae bacterium]
MSPESIKTEHDFDLFFKSARKGKNTATEKPSSCENFLKKVEAVFHPPSGKRSDGPAPQHCVGTSRSGARVISLFYRDSDPAAPETCFLTFPASIRQALPETLSGALHLSPDK